MAVEFYRSDHGYGWSVTLLIRGKHRARWTSTRGTSCMWPGLSRGTDENCNRAVTLMAWPLGHLDVWWEPNWRTESDGSCDECRRAMDESCDCGCICKRFDPANECCCETEPPDRPRSYADDALRSDGA